MRHPPQDQIIPDQERASTGIPGLDHILGGGLPASLRRGVENGDAKGALPLLSDAAAWAS